MCAIVVATALSNQITKDTIYTLKLRRRGIDIDAPRTQPNGPDHRREAMGKPRKPIEPDQPLTEIVERFAAERADSLPVINAVGSLIGVIAASDVERAISHGPTARRGALLARDVPRLDASDSLEDAVHALAATDDEGLPVTDEDDQLIGWITHRRVLRTYLNRFGAPQDTARTPCPAARTHGPFNRLARRRLDGPRR